MAQKSLPDPPAYSLADSAFGRDIRNNNASNRLRPIQTTSLEDQRVPISRNGPRGSLVTAARPPFYSPIPPRSKRQDHEKVLRHNTSGPSAPEGIAGLGNTLTRRLSGLKQHRLSGTTLNSQIENDNSAPDESPRNPMFFPLNAPEPTYPEHPRQGPHPKIVHIRRELYTLKDEIRCISVLLDTMLKKTCTSKELPKIEQVVAALKATELAINTILTNDTSDWAKSEDLMHEEGSQVSYSAFSNLSPLVILDLVSHLSRFREDLDTQGARLSISRKGEETILRYQMAALAEDDKLEKLLNIIELFESMLHAQTDDTSTYPEFRKTF